MDYREICKHVDHTLLSRTATWQDIRALINDGIKYGTASVCIPPFFVKQARVYLDAIKESDPSLSLPAVCTVIGFPNGYNTTSVKFFETMDAIHNGADEIDMVINTNLVKAGEFDAVKDEIKLLKKACGDHILKVIVETCLLTQEEKVKMCEIVTQAGADFIKTSTGFSTGGATREDIALFAEHIGEGVKMKAAGGIRSIEDAEDYLKLGCERLGTSAIVKIIKQQE